MMAQSDTAKRIFDFCVASVLLLVASPVLLILMVLIWLQDYNSPFYVATRVSRGGGDFRMAKLRSMVRDADRTGVSSTGLHDARITPLGHFIRRYKLDELPQLWNIVRGDMSFIGPRPNTRTWGVNLYTSQEMALLSVRPGISDFASIVFSDEGDILAGCAEPDVTYNQLIRPWKSRLGLLYVANRSLVLDVQLIWLTILAVLSRPVALRSIVKLLQKMNAPADIIEVAKREAPLRPTPPPGTDLVFSAPQ